MLVFDMYMRGLITSVLFLSIQPVLMHVWTNDDIVCACFFR